MAGREAGASVTAVDFSDAMLAEARRKPGADRVRFIAHDLHQTLPFPNAQFDLIISGLVLELLRELEPFFAAMRRVLKVDGRAVVTAMHPAMFMRGTEARFTDPDSCEKIQPGSIAHSIGDFVMAATRGGFRLNSVEEFAPNTDIALKVPRAAKCIDWPMLVVMSLRA